MPRVVSLFALVLTLCGLLPATPAAAQVLGTFRWQFAPYCNTVTLTIQQVGGLFTVSGVDDMCGAARSAPASGTAHLNGDGTVGMGITVIRPDGISVHHSAVFSPVSPTGTWSDNYGNSGTFAFSAPSPAPGSPRPVTLRGSFGGRGVAGAAVVSAAQVLSPISFGLTLPAPPAAFFVPRGGQAPSQCPGTAAAPSALPGALCVYESSQLNRQLPIVFDPNLQAQGASTFGAMVYIANTTSGLFASSGTWAVTVP